MSEGEFNIGGFVLLEFIKPVKFACCELPAQCISAIQNCLRRIHLRSPNAVAFSSICMHGIRKHISLGGYLDTRTNI